MYYDNSFVIVLHYLPNLPLIDVFYFLRFYKYFFNSINYQNYVIIFYFIKKVNIGTYVSTSYI